MTVDAERHALNEDRPGVAREWIPALDFRRVTHPAARVRGTAPMLGFAALGKLADAAFATNFAADQQRSAAGLSTAMLVAGFHVPQPSTRPSASRAKSPLGLCSGLLVSTRFGQSSCFWAANSGIKSSDFMWFRSPSSVVWVNNLSLHSR